jgi:sec-independent protein translocase protein TatA
VQTAISEAKDGSICPSHFLILLLIVLMLFGPIKLGDVGGAMGKAIRDFKKAVNEPDKP